MKRSATYVSRCLNSFGTWFSWSWRRVNWRYSARWSSSGQVSVNPLLVTIGLATVSSQLTKPLVYWGPLVGLLSLCNHCIIIANQTIVLMRVPFGIILSVELKLCQILNVSNCSFTFEKNNFVYKMIHNQQNTNLKKMGGEDVNFLISSSD